jgi:hypothetical protein
VDRTNLVRAAVASAGCLLLTLAPAATGADPATAVTITFTGTGSAPLVCGSRPDVAFFSLTRGQVIILTNLTGAEATIDVGGKTPRTVASGSGISVKLAVGEHILRMVPKCLLLGEVGQAVVMVVAGPPDAPTPVGPPPGGAGPSNRALGSPGPTGPASGPSGTAEAGTLLSASIAGTADPTAGPGVPSAPGGGGRPTSVPVEPPSDERGIRLLAIIAAICVLGVTAGIIRAIVTHRTRVSLRTMSTK